MQEDAADALAGYPRSHFDTVADFLAGQYQQDCVGPLLGACGGGGSDGQEREAATAAALRCGSGSMLDVIMGVLGRQAPVQAADSTAASPASGSGGGAAGGGCSDSRGSDSSASLSQLLAGLDSLCSTAFGATSRVISPTLALTGSLALGPGPSALAVTHLPDGRGAAAAVAWEGQPHVLLLRGAGGGGGERTAAAPEAAVLLLPEGSAAEDLAFYKQGALALLLAGSDACRLAVLPADQLQWVELPAELLGEAEVLQLAQNALESSSGSSGVALPDEGCRQCTLPYPLVQAPLAVSATRGVGCILAGTQVRGGGDACKRASAMCLSALCAMGVALDYRRSSAACLPRLFRSACCCMIWRRKRRRRRLARMPAWTANMARLLPSPLPPACRARAV